MSKPTPARRKYSFASGFSLVEIITALAVVLILSLGIYFYLNSKKHPGPGNQFQAQDQAQNEARREIPTPLVTQPPAEQLAYTSFLAKDGKFSFEYPASWTEVAIKNLETVLPKDFIDKYEIQMPLIASDAQGAQITLAVYKAEKGEDLDTFTNQLQADAAALLGQPIHEISRGYVNGALVSEQSLGINGAKMLITDILLMAPGDNKNTVYNVSFNRPEENNADYQTILSHVKNSVRLIR